MSDQPAKPDTAMMRRLAMTVVAGAASLLCAAAVQAGQLLVAAANSQGDAIYELTRATSGTALVSGTLNLNTDAAKHGSFDSLVWVANGAGSLDLIVADASKQQIVRYAGPNYGASTTIYSWSGLGHGPAQPDGLSVDAAGNLYVISSSCGFDSVPSLWVLPVNPAGGYGSPVLIDHSFGGLLTLKLAETVVAGGTTNLWNTGDLLVLVGDTFDARVIVYSHQAIAGVLANPAKPLSGPTSTAVQWYQFLENLAVPMGMDVWPADASHGVSLLFPTIDGRILRFETSNSGFITPFAGGLGPGLHKLKVGSLANAPYAFVAQSQGNGGRILEFGAPPASGANAVIASISKGVDNPVGLALTSSAGSGQAASCVAPNTCDFLGGLLTHQISGPGAANVGGVVLEQSCVVPTDPRVSFLSGVWTCNGSETLDVATLCPGYPHTIIPGSMCGHSGPTGAGFAVVKATADGIDPVDNNSFIKTQASIATLLPGPLNLTCPQVPVLAWAPRPDLVGIEGTIPEDALSPFFVDMTGFCDDGGSNLRGLSMYALGMGLNKSASGLPGGLPAYVTAKYTNLQATVGAAAINATVATTLQSCISTSEADFNSGVGGAVNGFSCAAYQAAVCDAYVRANTGGAFSSNLHPAGGNPNPAGDIDGRLANLYLTINTRVAGNAPNTTWPANNIPACVTLTAPSTATAGAAATLSWVANGVPAGSLCALSSSDGHFNNLPVAPTATASTGILTTGTHTYDLTCPGPGASGMAMASIVVAAAIHVAVPNVVGDTQAAAGTALTTAGLVAGTVTNASSATVAAGKVISENPVAGTSVLAGSAVALVISTGPPPPTVPNVVAATQASATSTIQSVPGLKVGSITAMISTAVPPVPVGEVISQSPAAGSTFTGTLANPTPVNLVFSGVIVPNVAGEYALPLNSSGTPESQIIGAGLTLGTLKVEASGTVPNNFVIDENPPAGSIVAGGATVNLDVSDGPTAAIASFTTTTPTVTVGNAALLNWSATGNQCEITVNGVAGPTTGTTGASYVVPLTLAGSNSLGLSCTGGGVTVTTPAAQQVSVNVVVPNPVNNPSATLFSNGVLYVANAGSGQVLAYAYGAAGSNGQFTQLPLQTLSAGLAQPQALAADNAGNIYVADAGNGSGATVAVFNSSGQPVGTPFSIPEYPTGIAVDSNGNVYVAVETEGSAQIMVYSSPLGGSSSELAAWSGDSANSFCGTGALAVSADGNNLLAGLNYGGGCDSNAVIAYPFSELTDSDAMLTPALAPFPVPAAPSGISVDTSVGSPNFGDIFASYNNYSDESVQIGVAQFDASGNPIDLQLTAGTGTQSLPNPGQQTASAVTVVDYTSAGMPPAPDTLYLFVADSQSSTLNVYQASGAPAQPEASTPYNALYSYTLEPTVTFTATFDGQPVNPETTYSSGDNIVYSWTTMGVPSGNVSGTSINGGLPCALTDNAETSFAYQPTSGSTSIMVPPVFPYTVTISCQYETSDGSSTITLTPQASVSINEGG